MLQPYRGMAQRFRISLPVVLFFFLQYVIELPTLYLVENCIVCGQTQKGVDESVPWSCVLRSCTLISFTYGLLAIEWWPGDQIRSQKAGWRVFIEDFPLMAPVFSVCQPFLEVIISVKSFAALYPLLYSHRIAVAYCSCHRIMLGGMLRFRDNFMSYYDRGVFVIVGAAIFTPPP